MVVRGGEKGLIRIFDLRILSVRNGGWFSWLSSSEVERKTRDRRTEPKKSCICTIGERWVSVTLTGKKYNREREKGILNRENDF